MATPGDVDRSSAGVGSEHSSPTAVVDSFQPLDAQTRRTLRGELDPAFAHTATSYLAGLLARPHLDIRTRLLVLVGQYTMKRYHRRLEETVCAAVRHSVPQREVLEVVLQCFVYGGDSVLDGAPEAYRAGLLAAGVEPDDGGLQVGQRDTERDLTAERRTWHPDDVADPRLEAFAEKYGIEGIGTGLTLRPKHILNVVEFLDSIDEEFADLWLHATYHGMYSRLVLDHRTRLLCMVGDLICLGETIQSRHHMRGAIRQGATPREVLEVVFQSCAVFGHEYMIPACVNDLEQIVADELGESLRRSTGP